MSKPRLSIIFIAVFAASGALFAVEAPFPEPAPTPIPTPIPVPEPVWPEAAPIIPGAGLPTIKPSPIKRPSTTPEVQPGTSPSGMSVTPDPVRPLDPLLGSGSPLQRPVPVPSPAVPLTPPAPVAPTEVPR